MNVLKKYGKNKLRGGLTLLDNLATYMLDTKAKRGPLFVGWDIITACNARCSYCHRWKKENQATKPLTKSEKLRIVKELGKAGVWLLSLCGGEPLLDKDLMDVIKTAKQHNLLVNISSNGFLLPKKAEQLILQLKSKIDHFICSDQQLCVGAVKHLKQVTDVLESLNYSRTEIQQTLIYLREQPDVAEISFDQIMRHALSFLAKKM